MEPIFITLIVSRGEGEQQTVNMDVTPEDGAYVIRYSDGEGNQFDQHTVPSLDVASALILDECEAHVWDTLFSEEV